MPFLLLLVGASLPVEFGLDGPKNSENARNQRILNNGQSPFRRSYVCSSITGAQPRLTKRISISVVFGRTSVSFNSSS